MYSQDVAQICPLRPDTKVIKHGVTLGECELGTARFFLQRVLDGVEVLIASGRSITLSGFEDC